MQTVQVRLPNSVVLEEECRRDISGREFLEIICQRLDIYETDYFGLKQLKKDASCWLFLRRPLFDQIRKNARLMLCTKYFVDPSQIQQSTTKRLFYQELREKVRAGDICFEEKVVPRAGALMCKLERLSSEVMSGRSAVLTRLFPEHTWRTGISWDISQQLTKLQDKCEREVLDMFLRLVSAAEGYGTSTFSAETESGREAVLTLGRDIIALRNASSTEECIEMPVCDILEIGYTEKELSVWSRVQDSKGTHLTMRAKLANRKKSREIFRCITEHHVYFYQRSVPEGILFHRYKPMRIRKNRGSYLLFDVIRTREESYAFHFARLHRLETEDQRLEDSVVSCANNASTLLASDSSAVEDLSQLRDTTADVNNSSLDVTYDALDSSRSGVCSDRSKRGRKAKQDYCKICYAYRVKTVFCPCGHSVSCISCAKRVNSCPICRRSIAHKQTIFTA